MPAVDGLSAFKQCAKIADFRRVPSHATFCLCRGATASSDQMPGIAGHILLGILRYRGALHRDSDQQ
jgi:hypothetical protein